MRNHHPRSYLRSVYSEAFLNVPADNMRLHEESGGCSRCLAVPTLATRPYQQENKSYMPREIKLIDNVINVKVIFLKGTTCKYFYIFHFTQKGTVGV